MYVHFVQQPAPPVDWCDVARVTIDMLPDVALLEIFDFYVDEEHIQEWHILVHVCRKWRDVVFGSPRRLNLRLYCRARTPVRKTLYIWPVLPIVISANSYGMWDTDNIIAALEHGDRICHLDLFDFTSSQFEKVLAATQQPFPALTHLKLRLRDETAPIVPDSFLGGSAPQLRRLTLDRIPFPELPKLLLSATHLVNLDLHRIPYSGYFSPEGMVTCFSVLTNLKCLNIEFEFSRSWPDQKSRRPPPPTRALLPALTELQFIGVSEYLEDLVARIDAPLLDKSDIIFFHQLIFDTPQLAQFISRTPKFKASDEVHVIFHDGSVWVTLPQTFDGALQLGISCSKSDWQLSSLAQVCSLSFPHDLISMVEQLYIQCGYWDMPCIDDIENNQWLELLHPFTSVKHLYISSKFTSSIVPAFQGLSGERVMEVLPALESLFVESDPSEDSRLVEEGIGQFVSARQLAGHPIAVSHWEEAPPVFSTLAALVH